MYKKRIISLVLATMMLLSLLSTAFAADLTKTVFSEWDGNYEVQYFKTKDDYDKNKPYKTHYHYVKDSILVDGHYVGGIYERSAIIYPSTYYGPAGQNARHAEYYDKNGKLLFTEDSWTKDGIDYTHRYDAKGVKFADFSFNYNPSAKKFSTGWNVKYDASNGNRMYELNYDTGIDTYYNYNDLGKLTSYQQYKDTFYQPAGKEVRHAEFFDAKGKLLGTHDFWEKDGIEYTHQYDGNGNRIGDCSIDYNKGGKHTGWEVFIDEDTGNVIILWNYDTDVTTRYSYNSKNVVTAYNTSKETFYAPAKGDATHVEYFDGKGNYLRSEDGFIDEDGNNRVHQYNRNGELVGNYVDGYSGYRVTLNSKGLITWREDFDTNVTTNYVFNDNGVLLGTNSIISTFYAPAKGDATHTTKYDAYGNFIGTSDSFRLNDETHIHNYDANGKQTGSEVWSYDRYKEIYTTKVYDSLGKLQRVEVEGENTEGLLESKTYNAEGGLMEYTVATYLENGNTQVRVFDAKHNLISTEITDADGKLISFKVQPKYTWYPSNTMCTAGLSLRTLRPELTNKWYNVTPVDLSRDGVQSFDLVASNKYLIGSLQVEVKGDEVTVNYNCPESKFDLVRMEKEFFTFFDSLDGITEVEPEKLGAGFKFGDKLSIEKDLGGNKAPLLFVCNTVTYREQTHGGGNYTRYWPNLPERKVQQQQMLTLIGK